jgi:N-acetylmuramoyl-L-alanine amidase
MKIFISPSQQAGNIGYGNYGSEKTRMFEIGKALKADLERCGHKVFIATEGSSYLIAARESNDAHCDLHICIHSNALNTKARGALGMYYSEKGKELTQCIYNKLADFTPTTDLGISKNSVLFELTQTYAVAAYIEVMFHDNKEDATLIMVNIETIASLIARGICDYLKTQYVVNPKPTSTVKYRIIVDTFTSKVSAKNRVVELQKYGIDSWIDEVK